MIIFVNQCVIIIIVLNFYTSIYNINIYINKLHLTLISVDNEIVCEVLKRPCYLVLLYDVLALPSGLNTSI